MAEQQFIDSSDRTSLNTLPTTYQRRATVSRFIPTTGQTVTIPDTLGDQIIIIAPATDLSAMTIAWPVTPVNGQQIRILSTKNIASISHSGGSLNRSISSCQSGADMNFIYDLAATVYMCDGVTLSQVVSLPFSATTASGAGNAVFFATDSGLVGGTALFASIQSIQAVVDVADPNVAIAKPVVSNSNKTITINCQKQTFNGVTVLGISVLGSNTVANAPNGVVLSVLIHGILA